MLIPQQADSDGVEDDADDDSPEVPQESHGFTSLGEQQACSNSAPVLPETSSLDALNGDDIGDDQNHMTGQEPPRSPVSRLELPE